jgi:protein-S-isoprenylcysteine O-methyltransferase Ste14
MPDAKDHPGIYVPPPIVYAGIFMLSILLQRLVPLPTPFFHERAATIAGILAIVTGIFFNLPAIRQFVKTKNTLVTVKPANSLQTTGIYALTRNPMYVSLLLFYTGLGCIVGNWWTMILLPLLVFCVSRFVIRREENYLTRAFGTLYAEYRSRVRRWI